MSILDKLIGLGFGDDVTETSWWTDAVYHGLAQADLELHTAAPDGAAGTTDLTSDPV